MRGREGFSLVEVVLAVGIVAFALLAIFGLLGSSLKTSTDTLGAAEALSAREGLNDYFRAKLGGGNFSDTYTALRSGELEDVFVFTFAKGSTNEDTNSSTNGDTNSSTNGLGKIESAVYAGDDEDLEADAASRTGRLLRARLGVSPNFPILGSNQTVGNFTAEDLPEQVGSYSNASLGLSVSLYVVPEVDVEPGDRPVLRYDTTIPR